MAHTTQNIDSRDLVAYPRRWAALLVGALAMLVIGLDTTVLNVALPTLASDLHASTSQLQWFADAYLLVMAAALLPSGLLGDRFGLRPTMLGALLLFGAGSLACAVARTPEALIAARALLGLGSAAIMPLMFALLVVLFRRHERGKAMAVVSSASVVGLPLGPILGGWMLQHWSWHWVFAINLPICALAVAGVALLFPPRTGQPGRSIDVVGIASSSLALVTLCYGLIEGPQRGWGDRWVIGALATAALTTAAFIAWEARRGERALMDLRLWRSASFRWGSVAAAFGNLVGFAGMFYLPQYLQLIFGKDAIQTGLGQLPMLGGMIVGISGAILGARLVGAKAALGLGTLLAVGGCWLAARAGTGSSTGYVALWSAVLGGGFGAFIMGGQNAALDQLPVETAGSGGGLIQVIRQLGSVIGIAWLPGVFSTTYRDHVDVAQLPAAVADTVRSSPQAGAVIAQRLQAPRLLQSVQDAFVAGGAAQMWASLVATTIVGTLLVLLIPNLRLGARERVAG